MSDVDPNYPTKKAFLSAVKAGVAHTTYSPSGMFPVHQDGRDVGFLPSVADWFTCIQPKDWMNRPMKLSQGERL